MECLDYSVSVNLDGVKADINRMLETGKMNELQVKSVNPWDIYTFVQSDTGRRVANAVNCGSVRREQPFVFEYEGQLIQGIIDLCFEEDGELVIVDYKTDRVMKAKRGKKSLSKDTQSSLITMQKRWTAYRKNCKRKNCIFIYFRKRNNVLKLRKIFSNM